MLKKTIALTAAALLLSACSATQEVALQDKNVNDNRVFNKITQNIKTDSFSEESMKSKMANFTAPNKENSVKFVYCGIENIDKESCIYGYAENNKNTVNQVNYLNSDSLSNDSFSIDFNNDNSYLVNINLSLEKHKYKKVGLKKTVKMPVDKHFNFEMEQEYSHKDLIKTNQNTGFILKNY
jgi:hypothetical protein